jgi:hypothetical protein
MKCACLRRNSWEEEVYGVWDGGMDEGKRRIRSIYKINNNKIKI